MALLAAAEEANDNIESMLERVSGKLKQEELLLRVLESAGTATLPGKILALGKVLAAGLNDDKVDESFVLAAALDDIEAPHVQVLGLIGSVNPPASKYHATQPTWWVPEEILNHLSGYTVVLPAVLQTLMRHGLVREPDASVWIGEGETPVYMTTLGRQCLSLIPRNGWDTSTA